MAQLSSRAPWVRITTPQVLLPYVITELVVHTEEGMHPWAQLTVRYYLSPSFQPVADQLPASLWWAEDSPVQISYGPSAASAAQFYGYVVSPEMLVVPGQQSPYTGTQMLDVRYTLLGVSKMLQTAKTKSWQNCTVAYMAQQIAAGAGLAAVCDAHPREFSFRQQASVSDFAFLQARACEVGWRLAVDGTTLYLTDPRRALVASVPAFSQSRSPAQADTMQAFAATVGETDPNGAVRAQHTAVGVSSAGVVSMASAVASRVDPVSGVEVPAQVQAYASGYVASSYADAQAITAAASVRDLWWVHARATVDGDARLRPGCVVALSGAAVTAPYAGEWMTRSAHHRITISQLGTTLSTYYVDLELGRDQPSSLTRVSSPQIPATSSVLVAGRWVSRPGVS